MEAAAAAAAALIQRVLGKRFLTSDTRRTLRRLNVQVKLTLFLFFMGCLFLEYSWLFFLCIGHGTYGTVMKCKHKLDHMEYVVKRIKVGYHDRDVILRY